MVGDFISSHMHIPLPLSPPHTHTHTHRLHDRIMEVGGSRVQQQQAQVDSVCRDIDQTSGAITKANVAIKTAERLAQELWKLC